MTKSQMQQTKVLVIEDNLIASKTAQMVLESKGCLVDCVSTGKAALDKLNEYYDLIILDLGLPDMNGFEVAKSIQSSTGPLALARIVIVTAFDSQENRELARQLNVSDYISKPLTIEKCELILNSKKNTFLKKPNSEPKNI